MLVSLFLTAPSPHFPPAQGNKDTVAIHLLKCVCFVSSSVYQAVHKYCNCNVGSNGFVTGAFCTFGFYFKINDGKFFGRLHTETMR